MKNYRTVNLFVATSFLKDLLTKKEGLLYKKHEQRVSGKELYVIMSMNETKMFKSKRN